LPKFLGLKVKKNLIPFSGESLPKVYWWK